MDQFQSASCERLDIHHLRSQKFAKGTYRINRSSRTGMAVANDSNEAKGAKKPRNGNTKRRKRNQPPLLGGFSTKNSHTSPKRIALRRRQSEALRFREQGYNYEQIAKHMRTNPSTVYRWVMAAMDRITAEPARRVLDLELRRLDTLQSAIYADAIDGDLSAQAMYLRIADQRAKLLGLYPKEPTVYLNPPASEPLEGLRIEFVIPGRKEEPPPIDVTPKGPPDYSKPALPLPPERRRGPLGWLEERLQRFPRCDSSLN
jgi:transposase-like protein